MVLTSKHGAPYSPSPAPVPPSAPAHIAHSSLCSSPFHVPLSFTFFFIISFPFTLLKQKSLLPDGPDAPGYAPNASQRPSIIRYGPPCTFFATKEKKLFTNKFLSCIIPVFRRYKIKNGAKTPINGYASFLFAFPSGNNW